MKIYTVSLEEDECVYDHGIAFFNREDAVKAAKRLDGRVGEMEVQGNLPVFVLSREHPRSIHFSHEDAIEKQGKNNIYRMWVSDGT